MDFKHFQLNGLPSPGEMPFHSGTEGILEELPSQTKEAVEIAPKEDFFESVAQSVETRDVCV